VSLTSYAMPVGNQGQVGSCAAWATDYTALGYWENKQGIAGSALEPMYTYSQLTGGVDEGSTIEGNLQIDEQGVDNQSDYWQGNFDYYDMPTPAEKDHAVNWKLTSYSDLPTSTSAGATVTQLSIETALAGGTPVVIGIPVYDNFFYVTSANNGYYSGISGSLDGYHAITALGYNSSGLVIENSWGTGWGNQGYATLSWAFVNGYVFDAVAVGALASGQPVNTAAPALSGNARQGQPLTASPGSWSPAASSYAYQWERAASGSSDWATIGNATSATYVPATADAGDDLRVLVTATNSKGQGAANSAQVGPVSSGPPVSATAPTVTGAQRVGQTLTATSGTWSPAATSYAYQWQRSTNAGASWSNITGATSATYVTVTTDVNAYERVVVTATNSAGSATASSAAVGPISGTPYNTIAPVVSGTLRVGQTLTATSGTWSPAATSYAYQWQRSTNAGASWSNITGATSATYVAVTADVNAYERVVVTATNSYGSATASSAAVGPIASGAPANVTLPTLTGTLRVGQTLTATSGTWSPAGTSYAYQWQRSTNAGASWSNITGATSATYATVTADVNAYERVVVTATNSYGSATASSTGVGPIASGAPANVTLPTLTGTLRVGQTLTATSGTWSPAGTSYAYQWQRSSNSGSTWSNITGATSATYATVTADVNAYERVVVTATNSYGSATASSTAVGPIASGAPANTTLPTATGTLRVGQTLTATSGTWSPAATSYAYQWQRSTNSGSTWSNITGATSATYVTVTADVSAYERVAVTATNSYGSATASSTGAGPISGTPYDTIAPVVSGTLRGGQTLTATSGTWSPAGTSYAYQWQRSSNSGSTWSNITGATSPTYVTVAADANAYERVVVTAANSYGLSAVDSAGVGPIAWGAPINVGYPTVAGILVVGEPLTALTGTWSPSATSYAYQWQRSTNSGSTWSNITGATGATYVTVTADARAYDRVVVTATNSYGSTAADSPGVGAIDP
jgi:hypothetical protein